MRLKIAGEKKFAIGMAAILIIVALASMFVIANDTYRIIQYQNTVISR